MADRHCASSGDGFNSRWTCVETSTAIATALRSGAGVEQECPGSEACRLALRQIPLYDNSQNLHSKVKRKSIFI